MNWDNNSTVVVAIMETVIEGRHKCSHPIAEEDQRKVLSEVLAKQTPHDLNQVFDNAPKSEMLKDIRARVKAIRDQKEGA